MTNKQNIFLFFFASKKEVDEDEDEEEETFLISLFSLLLEIRTQQNENHCYRVENASKWMY